MEKVRTDRQVVFDEGIIKHQKDHPEINVNATSRKLWWDMIKESYPDEFILLQKFIPCTKKDFLPLDRIYSFYKSKPIFLETGGFQLNKVLPDFKKIVPGDLPEPFRKNCINYMIKCFEEHQPFADLTCYDDYRSNKFTDFEKYSIPKSFTRIENGFRFLNFKYVYSFKDSPETEARKKAEREAGEIERANKRTQQYNFDVQKRQDLERIKTELAEKEWEKREKEKKEKLEAEKLEKEKEEKSKKS